MTRVLLVFMLILVGCTSPSGPDLLAAFDAERVSSTSNPPVVTAQAVGGTVTVRGEATTACQGNDLRAKASRRGDSLLLRIRWTEVDTCLDMPGQFHYEAVLADLPPGTYRVQVAQPVHEPPSSWPVRVVLEQTVTVE